MMSVREILGTNSEDAEFEALAAIHEDLIGSASALLTESDLQAIRRYLQHPHFPGNLAMVWTVALAGPPCEPICQFAADCIRDTSSPCRDFAAQYLRFHCSGEFAQCFDRIMGDDDLDVRFEAIDHICLSNRTEGIRQMITIVHGLSHSNIEIVRQYLLESATREHVADLRSKLHNPERPLVYEDLLKTLSELRPELS